MIVQSKKPRKKSHTLRYRLVFTFRKKYECSVQVVRRRIYAEIEQFIGNNPYRLGHQLNVCPKIPWRLHFIAEEHEKDIRRAAIDCIAFVVNLDGLQITTNTSRHLTERRWKKKGHVSTILHGKAL